VKSGTLRSAADQAQPKFKRIRSLRQPASSSTKHSTTNPLVECSTERHQCARYARLCQRIFHAGNRRLVRNKTPPWQTPSFPDVLRPLRSTLRQWKSKSGNVSKLRARPFRPAPPRSDGRKPAGRKSCCISSSRASIPPSPACGHFRDLCRFHHEIAHVAPATTAAHECGVNRDFFLRQFGNARDHIHRPLWSLRRYPRLRAVGPYVHRTVIGSIVACAANGNSYVASTLSLPLQALRLASPSLRTVFAGFATFSQKLLAKRFR